MDKTGSKFQTKTKYYRGDTPLVEIEWTPWASLYKEYPDNEKIELPRTVPISEMNLHEAIKRRRSVREYCDKALSLNELGNLLWASTGINRIKDGYRYRTAPSAGGLYPIETYMVVNNIEKIDKGIYHYSIEEHLLEVIGRGDFGSKVCKAALGQEMCSEAAVVFIWTAIFDRLKWKYGQRSYRYIYLDAGHIAENLALTAASLKLGCCHIGALYDDEVNRIIGVDGANESVIYMSVVGYER